MGDYTMKKKASVNNVNIVNHTPLNVTWDGFGINDCNSQFKERIATFNESYRHLGTEIVLAVNSHEMLIEALRLIMQEAERSIADNPNYKTALPFITARARMVLDQVKGR